MSSKLPLSQHLIDVKYRVLRSLLLISAISLVLVACINLYNQRPIANFIIPVSAALGLIPLYFVSLRIRFRRYVKLFFMIFMTNLYLPVAWITSPGSFSAMSFYALLLIFISMILAEKYWEYLVPLIGLLEMLLLFQYEVSHPDQYNLYVSMTERAFDLSVNFIAASIILFVISATLNNHFDTEHQRLFKISITDQLTKVYNRRHFFQKLEECHYLSKLSGTPFCILMIDLNHFKQVNDVYGHHSGDIVLAELGSILINCSRKFDTPARYGGDEFILLLPETTEEQAMIVADRIRSSFAFLEERYKTIHLSLGIGIAEGHLLSIEAAVQLADEMLYQDKRKHNEKQNEKQNP